MKSLKKLLLLLCIGAIYNLYFTLINSNLTSWINIIIFIIFGYAEVFILELLFKYSIKFQKNIYIQILTIFLISSIVEIAYMLVTGLSFIMTIHFVLLGIPITIIGLLYWKYHVDKIEKLLRDKKSSLSN
ncbi:hypothetical protein CAC02_10980 [Streptococcus gallolyticus]|uniref:DUF3021 domain-containing protein n=1 Tax=Streptococcus gallolyticus TaxID=315405 RepID=A0A368UB94_9STRE|nr:hypothetical protein [Streptococcus gallolyticus]RCW15818.1 hypothetical protein CAC02_10980 [Streptococcus gallolyticus]